MRVGAGNTCVAISFNSLPDSHVNFTAWYSCANTATFNSLPDSHLSNITVVIVLLNSVLSIPYRILTHTCDLRTAYAHQLSIPYRILTAVIGLDPLVKCNLVYFQFPTGFSPMMSSIIYLLSFDFQFPTGFSQQLVQR